MDQFDKIKTAIKKPVIGHRQTGSGLQISLRGGYVILVDKKDKAKTSVDGIPIWFDKETENYGIGVKPDVSDDSQLSTCPTCGRPE